MTYSKCISNSKSDALQKAIEVAFKSKMGNACKRIESTTLLSHTPEDKDCGSIEKWQIATCEIAYRFVSDKNEFGECYESNVRRKIEVEIKSYDSTSETFTVEITNDYPI